MTCKHCNDKKEIQNVFIVGDLSQAEAMVVAELLKRCGYPKLWELYQDPDFDIHTWAASPIFNVPENEIVKKQRDVGKLSNHSGNYGAGPNVLLNKALQQGMKGIDFQFAKQIIEARHKQLPGLKEWWKDVERKLRQTRTITTCLGRRRVFFGRLDENTFRSAYGEEPQSTVGDVCNIMFARIWKKFSFVGSLLSRYPRSFRPIPLIQVHDEVVTRCPNIPEIINYVVKAYHEASIIPLKINKDKPLVIPIDLKIGYNWKDTVEVEKWNVEVS